MKLIIPMAGMGKRMRPHTLTKPKPLIPVAGKAIVQRLSEDIAKIAGGKIEEISYIIGRFGQETEKRLLDIAKNLGAKGKIYYQDEALGTAHAIYCAKESLNGPVIIAFADTLFRADFTLGTEKENIIWVQRVQDPSSFGVVKLDGKGHITDFIEKPQTPVSNLAIIGIYYFHRGESLRDEIKHLLDHKITVKGEYQITDALENMKLKGEIFKPGEVDEWLDCGNIDATVRTNQHVLEHESPEFLLNENIYIENAQIIPPCYIGSNCQIKSSVVGPYVSIGENCSVTDSVIRNSIVQDNTNIVRKTIINSMIGGNAQIEGKWDELSIGDFSVSK